MNLAESELPPDLRSKIIAIVEAPKWNEVSEGALASIEPQTPRHDSQGKARWVTHVVIWMFEHPTSTLFIGASLGSLSIAIFSHNLSKWTIPKFARRIAIAIFFLSILLFAAIGRLHNG